MTLNERITTVGTALAAPTITPDRVAEFPLRDGATAREYLVRIPADELGLSVAAGSRIEASGEAGWTVPGRSWRGESSRTIVLARSVRDPELALAA